MPHIIVEYSNNLPPEIDVQNMIEGLHSALSEEGVDKARIKTRAIELESYAVGDKGKAGAMVHVTLLLLEGRDIPTKQQYGQALHKVASDTVKSSVPDCAVTLEVRDMVSEAYIL